MVKEAVKPGFKQTEIGVIPEDWILVQIGDHFNFKNGLNKPKEFFGHGTPIVNYMDVYKNSGITVKDIRGKVCLTKPEINNYEVRKGDLFFTRTSETVDEIGMASVILDEVRDTVFSGFILRARPKTNFFDIQYKKYCFISKMVRKQIMSTSSYTTRALTNGRLLSDVVVSVPKKLKEQQAIAQVLSDTDELIEHLDKLITKKKNIKKGAMQELLTGKKRLPGFKKEWCKKELGELIADVADGGTPSTKISKYWGGNINWIVIDDIKDKILGTKQKLTEDGLKKSSSKFWKPGTIILSTGATIGEVGITQNYAATKQGICGIIVNDDVCNNIYLKFWFQQNKQKLLSLAQGSSIKEIRPPTLIKIKLKIPLDIKEQSAIAQVLSEMDAEIDEFTALRDKYKMIKEGMMQVLLTGKVRLKWN